MKRIFAICASVILALTLAVAGVIVISPKPTQAAVTNPASWTVWTGNTSYTTTQTSASKYIGNYELADYFAKLDVTPAAIGVTITLKIQTSADNVTWFDLATVWNGVSVDTTTTPARQNAIGGWMRWVATASTADTFTPTVKLILK